MAAVNVDTVKAKVNEILGKVPIVDEQIKKVADKLKVDKAFVAIGGVAVILGLIVLVGGSDVVL